MHRVLLIHWKPAEAPERIQRLAAAGVSAEAFSSADSTVALRDMRSDPPDAVVIDLGRLPSHGREVAIALRKSKSTRHVPLVFVDGDPAKVTAIRELLPDAAYSDWSSVGSAIAAAIRRPPANPVVPDMMQKYAETPLPKKLGIQSGMTLLLIGAPPRFPEALRLAADAGVTIRTAPRGSAELIMLFAHSRAEFQRRLPAAQRCLAEGGGLWIAWPKAASGVETDLTQNLVRERALAAGLVDYKVCSIDGIWSGLRFARAKSGGSPASKSKSRRDRKGPARKR